MHLCSVSAQFDEMVQIAETLANEHPSRRRTDVKERLAELLADSNIAFVSPAKRRIELYFTLVPHNKPRP